MSLESALAEEAREVVAILEGRNLKQTTRPREASPPGAAQSPVRSMLDIGPAGAPKARHASVAGLGVGVTKLGAPYPTHEPVRSMLDTTSPPPTPGSPDIARTLSRLSPPPNPRPLTSQTFNPETYQFDVQPSSDWGALPKRVSQGGKKARAAMASVFGSSSDKSRETRRLSFLGTQSKSRSPGPARSQSPSAKMLNTNSANLMTTPGKYVVSDSGQLIDMDTAYRRLSDVALLKSGGSLSQLPARKDYNENTGEQIAPDGGVRLAKDYQPLQDEDAIQTSDDPDDDPDDEGLGGESRRGRGRTRKSSDDQADDDSGTAEQRKPKSLLAAAEQERKDIAVNYKYSSLLDPPVEQTGSSGEKMSAKMRTGIHPTTSFDAPASGVSTPYDSDHEDDMDDIRRAQKMKIAISPIHSTPVAHRCIRQITRGEFGRFQEEAERGLRRQRMYLVPTDLSDEAAFAMEWAIGTVLRDGDTLLAVYAVDEEVGTGGETAGTSLEAGQGANIVKDMASAVKTLQGEVAQTVAGEGGHSPSPLRSSVNPDRNTAGRVRGADGDLDVSKMDKAERERYLAVQDISDRCVSLLRKTRLQVRVVVEVFHCKSPKHMLTEVIDFLEPTLVILGSRGRSALKGVLLGSFSNYLVTKSSVPVMVARKKLRKHSKSVNLRNHMRFSNVLQDPTTGRANRLLGARID